jgi:hypothetical protein
LHQSGDVQKNHPGFPGWLGLSFLFFNSRNHVALNPNAITKPKNLIVCGLFSDQFSAGIDAYCDDNAIPLQTFLHSVTSDRAANSTSNG